MAADFKFGTGDRVTIEGVNERVQNPSRQWWQLWKPRWVETGRPAVFEYIGTAHEIRNNPASD